MNIHDEFRKGYVYSLAQEKVETQLEIAALNEENAYLREQRRGSSIRHPDEDYNDKAIRRLSAKLALIEELESQL